MKNKAFATMQEDENALDVVVRKVGKHAAKVWTYLNQEATRANAGPKGSPFKDVATIAKSVKLTTDEVANAVIALAQNNLVSRITPDGRVAA